MGSYSAGMSLEDAMDADQDLKVTQAEAFEEIKRHHLVPGDFVAEVGDKEMYKASEVLEWLGY